MRGFMMMIIVAAVFGTTFGYSIPKRKAYIIPDCHRPENNGRNFAYRDDCSVYYRCDGDKPVLVRCPSRLWFNSSNMNCDYPEFVPHGVCRPPLDEEAEEHSLK